MSIKAQVAMVMNLDKCIGCHTCSVTCKNTWTNRIGAEYMYYNNVETKPGLGYPKRWEDQEERKGGWTLRKGELVLRGGSAAKRLLNLFYNPDLPEIDDYGAPWTYDYSTVIDSPPTDHLPVARPRSHLTGEPIDQPDWGPNWEDDLAGAPERCRFDPDMRGIERQVQFAFEQTFMFYLPRICEHCLNPSCVASCPSGAIYKRQEDGIVLVDEEACRGWRYCVSGCPYKKVYFNWRTYKAEKCTFCYPRIEAGMPTICSETCVGRLRYLGVLLYDADRVKEAASAEREQDLVRSQLSLSLDPRAPKLSESARADGINEAWLKAAQASPVYKLAVTWGIALPLHPEFRTLPMVWYIPPLSPMLEPLEAHGSLDAADVLPAIDAMRIPQEYLANLLSAGDTAVIRRVLMKLAAMRMQMRRRMLGLPEDPGYLEAAGLTADDVEQMVRLLAIAKYNDRYVIPTARREGNPNVALAQGAASFDELIPPEGLLTRARERRPQP